MAVAPAINWTPPPHSVTDPADEEPEDSDELEGTALLSEQFSGFQADAPACDYCGAITVRNGNCYLCHNCGHSMGCS